MEHELHKSSGGLGEGSEARDTHELRDVDSDQILINEAYVNLDDGDSEVKLSLILHWRSGFNSQDGRSVEENPVGDSIDTDRLLESQTVVVPAIDMIKPIGPDQSGSTIVKPITPRVLGSLTSSINSL
ncbi:hypothetical protein Tco_0897739, partial [Tanacetum coccineum]